MEEQKLVYIGSNPAHSALMNMPEHDSSTLLGQPPVVASLSLFPSILLSLALCTLGQSRPELCCIEKGVSRLSPVFI